MSARRVLKALPLAVVPTLAGPSGGGRPVPSHVAGAVQTAEFGVASVDAVRWGRLSVVLRDSPTLYASLLRDHPPPVRPVTHRTREPGGARPPGSGCFRLDAFESVEGNTLGGRFGTYALGGASLDVSTRDDPEERPALTLACSVPDGGVCGSYVPLFGPPDADGVVTYVDATPPVTTLAFWVRGSEGGERLLLKAADATWAEREDALPVGEVGDFLAGGRIEARWRRALVPLEALPGRLARDSLAMLVFEAGAGRTKVSIAGLALCRSADPLPPLPEPTPAPRAARTVHRALWMWNTRDVLAEDTARRRFVAFVRARGFDRVFLQLPPAAGARPERGFVPFDGTVLGPLIEELSSVGARVYALDGDPNYARKENHEGVFRTVDAVVRYNRGAVPRRRFAGVHYDVEPYLLPEFHGPGRRHVLDAYVALVAGVARHAHDGGLEVGVDIPFWLDAPDEETGRPLEATRAGRTTTVLEHVLEVVDDVAVMDYRTHAYGANGSIAGALGELEAARTHGVAVYVAVETEDLPDEAALSFHGAPAEGLPPEDGGWWVAAEGAPGDAARFHIVGPDGLAALRADLEARGVEAERVWRWRATRPLVTPGARLSFHTLGTEALRRETRRMVDELAAWPAFAGLAYHHYATLTEILG